MSGISGNMLVARALQDQGADAIFTIVAGPVTNVIGACAEIGADMLVMGAYTHSRLRQMILGGVTKHVLAAAELPVLMGR